MENNQFDLKCAVLLNKKEVSPHEWKEYIEEHWERLSKNLKNSTVLILAGRHGKQDGTIGPYEDRVLRWHEKVVSLTYFQDSSLHVMYCIYVFSNRVNISFAPKTNIFLT